MKSWTVARNGEPKHALDLKTDVPVPGAPAGNDILIKISYAALNPVDLHFMNVLPAWLPIRYHPTPSFDFAGEIVAVGPAVKDLKVGTQVCAAMGTKQVLFGKGALNEYAVVPADLVAVVPEKMSLAQAAGVAGIAGQTATLITQTADIQPGWKVLIIGVSGGVGSILAQIVKSKGAKVYGVCSASNAALVKGLGVDEVSQDAMDRFGC